MLFKKLVACSALLIFLLSFSACDDSLRITKIELGDFPDNIVYFANESSDLDLTGGTMLVSLKSGVMNEYPIDEMKFWTITDTVDFSMPGVYEVKVTWK